MIGAIEGTISLAWCGNGQFIVCAVGNGVINVYLADIQKVFILRPWILTEIYTLRTLLNLMKCLILPNYQKSFIISKAK